MPTEPSLHSITQLHKPNNQNQHQHQHQQPLRSGMWQYSGRRSGEEDDSWETKAFAEDTSCAMGSTWPPRSYTCTFCRREFRSAQALGGHMNVHRRDRARLHQLPHVVDTSSSAPSGGGLCLFYPLAVTSAVLPPAVNAPSAMLSMSAYGGTRLVSSASNEENRDGSDVEELDLELRLGW